MTHLHRHTHIDLFFTDWRPVCAYISSAILTGGYQITLQRHPRRAALRSVRRGDHSNLNTCG